MKEYKRLTEEDYNEQDKRKHLAIVLCNMRKRCYNPNSNCYKNYGGRGIKVCNEWLGKDGQKNFYKWAIDNGYRKGMSIDRIDNNGDYTPQNCRWATPKTQAYNRSTNSYVTIHGKTQTVSEWADEIGISRGAMQNRLRYGWSEDRLLEPQQVHLKMSKHEMRVEILKLREQLEEYRTKIENGTLIELPCKVGDKVYCIYHFDGWFEEDDMEYDIIPEEVVDIIIKEEDFDIGTSCRMIGKFQRVCVCFSIAEAEEKLKELQK